ncbi:hypothetical protein EUGRSUZ_I01937 [Eucalyptus grandis]|uniref:Uncharacterized protein n=2 Tax=Eucalyptus grandis TaxID=71139 RepID=A0ACC3JI48_EUCGR|nr:hypothetical protein EUGRSUZ_I01937 [Eucalyptus grandis]
MTVRDSRIPSFDAEKKKKALPSQQRGPAAAELAFAGAGARGCDRSVDRRRPKVSAAEEAATDAESGGSPVEVESPRSLAGKWMRRAEKELARLHSQVLRIREEDLHLGEDIGEGLSAKDKVSSSSSSGGAAVAVAVAASRADVVVFSRPNLPCSPLSGKVNPIQSLS